MKKLLIIVVLSIFFSSCKRDGSIMEKYFSNFETYAGGIIFPFLLFFVGAMIIMAFKTRKKK